MNPTIDISMATEVIKPTIKMRCHGLTREPGGGGINVARVIEALGGHAIAVYTAGGESGNLLSTLIEPYLPLRIVLPIAAQTRSSFTADDESNGDQYRFVLPGPDVTEAEWKLCLQRVEALLPRCDYLIASGSLPPGVPDDFYARLARTARRQDVSLSVDCGGPALEYALEEGLGIIKPNDREFCQILGRESMTKEEMLAAAEELVARGSCHLIAVSLGADGAIFAWPGGSLHLPVPKLPRIESAIGAGDSFLAGLVLAVSRGWPVAQAARAGLAAGSAALLTPGTELVRPHEYEALLKEIGENSASSRPATPL